MSGKTSTLQAPRRGLSQGRSCRSCQEQLICLSTSRNHALKAIATADGLAVAIHAEPAEQTLCVAIATPSHSADQLCCCYVLGLTGYDDHADCVHSFRASRLVATGRAKVRNSVLNTSSGSTGLVHHSRPLPATQTVMSQTWPNNAYHQAVDTSAAYQSLSLQRPAAPDSGDFVRAVSELPACLQPVFSGSFRCLPYC